jgi:hypothetical protein
LSTIRVATRPFVVLLVDLARTAERRPEAGNLGAVLLSTGRGYYGPDPGRVELLGGMSTDRKVMAYAHMPCSGQLPRPVLLGLRDLRNVVSVFKAAAGRDPDEQHAVELVIEGDGDTVDVTVREDPTLLGPGVSLTFESVDLQGYPARTLARVVAGDAWPAPDALGRVLVERDGRKVPAGDRVDVVASHLAPFVAVGKRRGVPVELFVRHPLAPVLVQLGDSYRGALAPWPSDDDTSAELPDVELATLPDLDQWFPAGDEHRAFPVTPPKPAGLFVVDPADEP